MIKELGDKDFVTTIEVANLRKCSGKANKFRFINTIREAPREITIKEWEIKIPQYNPVQFL